MKNIKVKKIIYPLLSGVFFLAVVVVFIYSVKFLSSNIKNVFDTDDSASSHLTSLDMDNFYRVAKKLGLEQITDNRRQTTENAISIITTNETTSATSTETVATTTSESVIVATTTIVVAATTTAPIAPLPLDKSAKQAKLIIALLSATRFPKNTRSARTRH
ncbi:hypothetical protein HY798_03175 [Candidatus Falkowbacteria bacterium]|nr:hypothetical protein [Candidatus Falkowbacteria bacterium]